MVSDLRLEITGTCSYWVVSEGSKRTAWNPADKAPSMSSLTLSGMRTEVCRGFMCKPCIHGLHIKVLLGRQ